MHTEDTTSSRSLWTTRKTGASWIQLDCSHTILLLWCSMRSWRLMAATRTFSASCIPSKTVLTISWVPNLVLQLTAESESNCYSATIMRVLHTKKVISHLLHGEKDVDLTVPICVNNSAAIIMNTSDATSRCTRHVESRCWFGKQAIQQGHAKFVKVDGALQQPANIGTKSFQAQDSAYCLTLFEAPYYTQCKRCHCD